MSEAPHPEHDSQSFAVEKDADIIQMPERNDVFHPKLIGDSSIPTSTLSSRLQELLKSSDIRKAGDERSRAENILHTLLVTIEALPPEPDGNKYPVEAVVERAQREHDTARNTLELSDFRQMFMDIAESLNENATESNLMRATLVARKRLSTVFGNELVETQRIVYLLLREDFTK